MKYSKYVGFIAVILLLSACNTFEGLKSDLGQLGTTINSRSAQLSQNLQGNGDASFCPAVSIHSQKSSLTEFEDPKQTGDEMIVSRIEFEETRAECEKEDEFVVMNIDMTLAGMTGPKAKRTSNDKPFFSYPYYISVMDLEGNELAREIFAANVSYESDQNQVRVVETIKQRLPIRNGGTPYKVEVGFSLTDDQLFYNSKPELES
ncbi:MAG: hypothetical protein AAF549_03500 [Pseudomonadota bacterium]